MVSKKVKAAINTLAVLAGMAIGAHVIQSARTSQIQEQLHVKNTPVTTETILHKAACTQYGFPSSLSSCYFRGYNKDGHGDDSSYVDPLGFHHYSRQNTLLEKDPDKLRLVTLGGSTMANFTAEFLEMILNGEIRKDAQKGISSELLKTKDPITVWGLESLALGHKKAEVINAAISGLNTNDVSIIYNYSIKQLKPDVIYINTGGIDVGFGMFFNSIDSAEIQQASSSGDLSRLVHSSNPWIRMHGSALVTRSSYNSDDQALFDETFSPEPYTSNLVNIVSTALSEGTSVGLIKPPYDFECPGTDKNTYSNGQGFSIYPKDREDIFSRSMPAVLDRITDTYANQGKSGAKVFVVDVAGVFNKATDRCDLIGSFDGIHPSEEGMLRQAAVIAQDLKGRINEAR